ncbi:MAG: enoyl-CoA hydratase/isomerase family protein [Ignavibacteria bacterium]
MRFKNILYKEDDSSAEVALNRPEKMNALDDTLISEITQVFTELNGNKNVKCIILSGSGGNFCSGLDIAYLQKISGFDLNENKLDSHRFKDMLLSIYNCSKPVVAKVSGYALAGGCGIATCCDFIIADETAKFGYTEVKIGFIPAVVSIFLMKKVRETQARDLLLTARVINSDEALSMGLVNILVNQSELDSEVKKMCELINKNSSNSISLTKELLRKIATMGFETALEYACDINTTTRMTEECRDGLAKFLSRKKP